MSKRKSPEKIESDRQHHLSFWKDSYEGMGWEIAVDLFRLAELNRRFQGYSHRMKVIDTNRRENAVALGVAISESDTVYSFDGMLESVPQIIEAMKEYEREYKVNFADLRPLDTAVVG